jgi:GDP-mannose 4,6-dehydratase
MSTTIDVCRICKKSSLIDVIDLGEQVITSRFPLKGDYSTPKRTIVLVMCSDCGLIQLKDTTPASELYEYEYGYRSGISNTMRKHLSDYQKEVVAKVELNDGDIVVDIGSNDSTTLQLYSDTITRVGIDPTGSQFKEYYGDVDLIPTYFTRDAFVNKYGDRKCKIVSSISMFYDLPDPVQFAQDIYSILDDNGIWTCEQSYLPTMLKRNSIDTICHEHLEYYALHQIKRIADIANFKIIDVQFNDCNGGSFRIYFAKKGSLRYEENVTLIEEIIHQENELDILNPLTYKNFMKTCDNEVKKLQKFIQTIKDNGKKIWIYGASTKGNCLLQYAELGPESMEYAVERNPNKVGKMTSTGIEIISEETMRSSPPDYLLVLPWHFRDEIVEREKEYLENGGQFIFPFPKFEIVSAKPRALITGCDGHISHYVKERFSKDYTLYGIGHNDNKIYTPFITKKYFDINDTCALENFIVTVSPAVIIHLAGISHSDIALENPIQTLHTNGIVTASLCDIIHRNNLETKLFNASSSEIYKGHQNYVVEEDDINMYHLHPYSIAKIMGHSIVDFYRTRYNLPFSNGILFTTESPKKSSNFLLNKVANHIKSWKNNYTSLELGSLDSYRNIIHAEDVANAIYLIIQQSKGDTYIICNNTSDQVVNIVKQMYVLGDIQVYQKDNILYEVNTHKEVLKINSPIRNIITNINGNCKKLYTIGWKPKYSTNDLLEDIINNK